MRKYEVLFFDGHIEIMNHDDTVELVDLLEAFEQDDVSQIHRLNKDGTLGKTIWTEEEGLLVKTFHY